MESSQDSDFGSGSEEDLSELNISNFGLSTSLYELLSTEGNVFYSPFSIQVALLLTYIGAEGNSADELIKTLNLHEDKKLILNRLKLTLQELKSPVLNMACGIFIEETYKVKSEFKTDVTNYFSSELQCVNFKSETKSAASFINEWVSKKTDGTINGVVTSDLLDEYTKLLLINAVHFKEVWKQQFDTKLTTDKPFYVNENVTTNVKMMYSRKKYKYVDTGVFEAAELPYKDNAYRLLIMMTKEKDELIKIEKELPKLNFRQLLNSMTLKRLDLHLPRFKVEHSYVLNEALQKLGIQEIFEQDKANLCGMFEETESPLFVSKVIHKAFIDVNEQGTEAAGATGVASRVVRCAYPHSEPITFKVDHPFIFVILYQNLILFIGKIVNPV